VPIDRLKFRPFRHYLVASLIPRGYTSVGCTLLAEFLIDLVFDEMLYWPAGERGGNVDSTWLQRVTFADSLRRTSPLDSVNSCTHNPKVGGSNPPPATTYGFEGLLA
jgi:hypothetical protein